MKKITRIHAFIISFILGTSIIESNKTQAQEQETNTINKNSLVKSDFNHPLMEKKNLVILYGLAQRVSKQIDQSFPGEKQVIIGLGQSPAYLLEMIKLIDQKQNRQNRTYMHVAFSGSFFSLNQVDKSLFQQFKKNQHYYETYLNKIGLDKKNLTDINTSYIILEVAHHCQGLKSFISFFDQYERKPNVLYLQEDYFNKVELYPYNNYRLTLQNDEQPLTVALANADAFKDRLVPQFQFHRWKHVDPTIWQQEENAQIVIRSLEKFCFSTIN